MTKDHPEADLPYAEWLATRPESVRKLHEEFKDIRGFLQPNGRIYYIIGYTEGDEVLVSPIDPREDFDGAIDTKVPLCASHLREAIADSTTKH